MDDKGGGDSSKTSVMLRAKGALEFSAAVGVLLFVVLSVMYDQFYGPMGVEPEDVGLTQTVIVQRALAGVALVVASGVAVVIAILAYQSLLYLLSLVLRNAFRRTAARNPERNEIFKKKVAQDQRFAKRVDALERWGSLLGPMTPFQLLGVTELAPPPWKNRRSWLIGSVFVSFAVLVVTFTVGLGMVREAADRAQGGRTVTPLTFAGIRVLDIESRPCKVTWLGAPAERPGALVDDDLHCLGGTSGTAVFRTSAETLRVPASLVVISLP